MIDARIEIIKNNHNGNEYKVIKLSYIQLIPSSICKIKFSILMPLYKFLELYSKQTKIKILYHKKVYISLYK